MASVTLIGFPPRKIALNRKRIAALIERLISLLDDADGDIEAEEGTWPENIVARRFDIVADENLEEQHDAEAPSTCD